MTHNYFQHSCFTRAVALAFLASLYLTAIAQTSNSQLGTQSPQIAPANRIATPIKTWPQPGSPMELLPKIEFQPLTDEDMRMAYAYRNANETPKLEWNEIQQKTCLTQFWSAKPIANERPFMITTHAGLDGFIKFNNFVAQVNSSIGDKLGHPNDYGKGELDSFKALPTARAGQSNPAFVDGARYLKIELRKTTQKSCSFLNSHCKMYSAEAYVYWTSHNLTAKWPEGPREELRNVYTEDRCVNNVYKTQLFDHRAKPSLLDRLVGLFFSKS
jgi:hypothetical protein